MGGIGLAPVQPPWKSPLTMAVASARIEAPIERVTAAAYTVPTERPESDGTLEWDETTIVVIDAEAGGVRGLGFSYTGEAAARMVERRLAPAVAGVDVMDIPAAWSAMVAAVRNVGLPGLASTAISAVDVALWDLKARLLDLPLVKLLGVSRPSVPIYASGGFTSYDIDELTEQLGRWVDEGTDQVKIKVGRSPRDDLARVRAARRAIGPNVALFVDANGAYATKQALSLAEGFARFGVSWFEEPVSSNDLEGLRLLRAHGRTFAQWNASADRRCAPAMNAAARVQRPARMPPRSRPTPFAGRSAPT